MLVSLSQSHGLLPRHLSDSLVADHSCVVDGAGEDCGVASLRAGTSLHIIRPCAGSVRARLQQGMQSSTFACGSVQCMPLVIVHVLKHESASTPDSPFAT